MIDKDLLLKSRLTEQDYEIPDVGTIRIRILSWDEIIEFKDWTSAGQPADDVYAKILHLALVDPAISEDEAKLWFGNAPGGEIEALVQHIIRSSGLFEGAQKSVRAKTGA